MSNTTEGWFLKFICMDGQLVEIIRRHHSHLVRIRNIPESIQQAWSSMNGESGDFHQGEFTVTLHFKSCGDLKVNNPSIERTEAEAVENWIKEVLPLDSGYQQLVQKVMDALAPGHPRALQIVMTTTTPVSQQTIRDLAAFLLILGVEKRTNPLRKFVHGHWSFCMNTTPNPTDD